MLKYFKRAFEYLWYMVLLIGASLVSIVVHALVNALGVWIVLEQFDYSLPGFWSYIVVGWGLAIILNGNITSSND